MNSDKLKDKFIGCMLGTHVGDALGMPVEGYDCKAIEVKYGELREMLDARMGAGTYTDDTEMMIGIAESLVECKGFNGRDMADRFVKLYNPERGYGGDTDTIGAMTGAISGAYHGKKGIPQRWLDVLENGERGRDYIKMLAEKLWEIKSV